MRALILYSGQDKVFVKHLNASLKFIGFDTVLVKQDSKDNNQIPFQIESRSSEETCLINVISRNSVNSSWLHNTLSIEKMKETTERGFKVLLVIIGKLKLPAYIKHIKYTDFTGWKRSEQFYKGLEKLLTSLDLKPIILSSNNTAFVIRNCETIVNLASSAWQYSAMVNGLIDGLYQCQAKHSYIDLLSKRAYNRHNELRLPFFIADLIKALNGISGDSLTKLRNTLNQCKKDMQTSGFYRTDAIQELADFGKHYETLAIQLTGLISESLLYINTSMGSRV
jgi:hypothetical protein